jgi:hypothetical protein
MKTLPNETVVDNKYRVLKMLGYGDAVYRVLQLGIDVGR